MIITDLFKFTGEDGSMGFCNGEIYLLKIMAGSSNILITTSSPTAMERWQVCPYDSWFSFFQNWERV